MKINCGLVSEDNSPESALEKNGEYVAIAYGNSMMPMIEGGKDVVKILPAGKIKKYDVVLYRRGEKLVLHRVVKLLKDGRYLLRGDNSFYTEISDGGNFIGVLSEYNHKDKTYKVNSLNNRMYSFIRIHTFWMRRVVRKLSERIGKKS